MACGCAGPAPKAVAATKTYSSELLALWLLVNSVAGAPLGAAADLPAVAQSLVARFGVALSPPATGSLTGS